MQVSKDVVAVLLSEQIPTPEIIDNRITDKVNNEVNKVNKHFVKNNLKVLSNPFWGEVGRSNQIITLPYQSHPISKYMEFNFKLF